MSTKPIIKITDLSKRFNQQAALRNVDLDIQRGSIVGLVGGNGAGKSTLMRIMTGIYLPSRGTCTTLGQNASDLDADHLRRIGYVHQESKLIGWMRVGQLIRFVAGHYPDSWNDNLAKEFVERFGIPVDVRVSTLSPGRRQQLAILLAIGHEPELLILDEPASGLDPLARFEFLQILLDLIQTPDRTIIISSHILTDIEQIIDHIVILKEGTIVRDCSFDVLQEEFVQVQLTSREAVLPDIDQLGNVVWHEHFGKRAVVVLRRENFKPEMIAAAMSCELQELPLNFESVYRLIVAPGSFRHQPLGLGS